jgi:hypothetical protein
MGVLLLMGSTANATTLWVNCSARSGLGSINGALKTLKSSEVRGPATINVSGACRENVVIQGLDRLTLTAVNGASVSDASGGTLDVISIADSRDVAINGLTVNGSAGDGNGISCNDYSTCRLSGNVIQGRGNAGFAVYSQSQATLDGDTLQNNGVAGLQVRSGSTVRAGSRPFISRANGQGINIARQALAFVAAVIENNLDQGVVVGIQSTFELTGSITGNGSVGAHVREGSVARFTNATISGNAGAGVLVHDLSMVSFNGTTVTGNAGGAGDVVCNPQYPVTSGVVNTGGTTNCVEP